MTDDHELGFAAFIVVLVAKTNRRKELLPLLPLLPQLLRALAFGQPGQFISVGA